ncbi:transporter substrate-binding domain-containing protein [Pseudomonas asgharzadehiana]|uniref:Transporter substrate-binding domain-containing protein n=2 Tax=Pseudomonas TaxID=286 RepID=A0ABX8NX49_9PSED|nr:MULTISPECIES: transporter substrate-binding domain-containing protein [Pseudomonas]MCX9149871.1 transporter substrate-binding domain-containing protein [Pseudomonas sp. TB1-B1]QXH66188.1 transporter substrate-binding domain-containing protein [Pseudomonas asgharzadehiana]TKJ66127.1 ABC transporter substrate-binding protein [Pseudomonas sp. CFBP13506]
MELRPWALLLGLSLLPGLALAAGKCERLVITGSPDTPPLLWRDPQDPTHLIGATADVLQQVTKDLGVKIDLLYGGNRSMALDEVRSGRMDIFADAPLNHAQLGNFDYIHPALVQTDYRVWTRTDSALVYASATDLQGFKGAASERARLSQGFETLAQHLTLQRFPSLTPAFQKLLLGEVDYVLAGRYSGMAMAQTLGMSNDLIARDTPVDQAGLHLAISHNSACNDPWLRGQLAKKMTELPGSGVTEAALQRNLERWKAQLQQPVGTPTQ